jgi:hypothetical protein
MTRVVLFIDSPDEPELLINGYGDDYVAWIALLVHLRSLFRSRGQDVQLVPLGEEEVAP